MFKWDWEFTWQILPRLIHATGNTLVAALSGYAIAVVLGLVLALLNRSRLGTVRWTVREVIEFVRSTPLLVQIFFVFYVAPQFGLRLTPWVSGMIAIGLHYACYLAEVYRGGIEGVGRGQWEAAVALNMTKRQTYVRLILPQALPLCLPGMGNYLVGIFKDTPLLSVIGVAELMHTANAIGAENYRFLEPYTLVGLIFLAISLHSAALMNLLDRYARRKLGM
ncbi:ectoine/hydroxyectoine ABC transporter permease subunit EhuD [Sinorhizobium meliloti]|uniref:ectoine/hydroxyectoine ABC transporter permease subunit EhuD n=1 Tax=Rhizobium meliloti TaxID=382 RepID=UPI001295F6E3|nr:ectoine/hydroxyectoine ABC transporter permease subunit EhuD [Sinorhizobium meliloti]MDW9905664.1 ectoine/hydroxyectoine ABC transporter permease subunit EhuD [Sinorhizobium meliloti]MDX0141395.1 ectoine/hydroxyectoine ABC transporter permease subunit EhuD [Sinorhizobium meliloti]MDX0384692.1 ectoine/hydroxyectoine ABC transporter permease subunit EhuD [Sinorhizobium meliloti]MQW65105.1 ectoine/hydroxyectoine ABC transporter permease subunit EhuD [Sinorhizobium meliloti]